MDAHALAYADASFDCVVGQFVITLVADPERVLSECARVVRPGGQIILVNHLYSERGLAAAVERLLAQKARPFGLRPEFPFQRLADWALSARRCRADRAAQAQAVWRLHAGAISGAPKRNARQPKDVRTVNGAVTILKRGTGTCRA